MEEFWKKIENYDNYQASNYGRVKKVKNGKERILKPQVISSGYEIVALSVNSKSISKTVHRLIAQTFIENNKKKECVNHINGIKTDNRVENLEWNTKSENAIHAYKKLGIITNGIKSRKIMINEIDKIKKLYFSGKTQKEISEIYGVHQSTISHLLNNRTYIKWV
jgi:predicted XRE-type DNA-binding protein